MVERMPPGSLAPMPRRLWWLIVLRGIAALLFGLVAIFWPGISLAVLVIIFGAYALVDGTITLMLALRRDGADPARGFQILTGISGLLLGLLCVLWPEAAVTLMIYLVAAWIILFGIMAIASSLRMRRQVGPGWPVSRGGILLIAIGLLLLLFPNAVVVAATWVIGIGALLLGAGLLAFAWRRHQQDNLVL
ncbi:MAG: HdeD family acid-resistance protein [Ferrovibrio sp.]|uniref:HdeD family acid-resistance protein n=1 Tax=Ferrovibrio sp. TaxID=1917215 RepID=UPI00391CE0A9